MEGCVGRSRISVVCVGMEAVDGGLGSRVGACGWMGMVDFSRLDVDGGLGSRVAGVDGWGWRFFGPSFATSGF